MANIKNKKGVIGILTGGGDVPGLNPFRAKGKLEDYPTAKFYNEVLGLPYDSGVKPITEAQLRACCTYGNIMEPPDPNKIRGPVFAGIDWGTGGVAGQPA